MKRKPKGLSLIEKMAVVRAVALPIVTFLVTFHDSQEVGPEVEI